MVRNIVGTLVEVGRGGGPQLTSNASWTVAIADWPGPRLRLKGLCLMRVMYASRGSMRSTDAASGASSLALCGMHLRGDWFDRPLLEMRQMYYPSFDAFKAKAGQGNLIPVYREIMADLETPVAAFLKLDRGDFSFLLESVEGGEKWGRYCFLGGEPSIVFQSKGSRVEITRNGQSEVQDGVDPLDALKHLMQELPPGRGRRAAALLWRCSGLSHL